MEWDKNSWQGRLIRRLYIFIIITMVTAFLGSCNKASETGINQVSDTPTAALTAAATATATPERNESTEKIPTLTEQIDNYLTNKLQGTIYVEIGKNVIINKGYGYSDLTNGTLNDTDTLFQIGSITKQFTAAAIMMLVEEGKISVQDTLDKYLPEYPYADQITIKEMLNMTSGIPDYVNDFSKEKVEDSLMGITGKQYYQSGVTKHIEHEDVLNFIKEYELNFKPGSQYKYSNTNYYFLGMVIEKITGKSYEDFVQKNIFDPLGMTSTSFHPEDEKTIGYIKKKNEQVPSITMNSSLTFSAGSIVSNSTDMGKWADAVLTKKLLSEASWSEILDGGKYNYGYGWGVDNNTYCHSGVTAGFNASILICPELDLKLIILSNIDMSSGISTVSMSKEILQMSYKQILNVENK